MNPQISHKFNYLSLSANGGLGFHQEMPLYDDLSDEWCTSSLDDVYCSNIFELEVKPMLFERSSDGWTAIPVESWEVC